MNCETLERLDLAEQLAGLRNYVLTVTGELRTSEPDLRCLGCRWLSEGRCKQGTLSQERGRQRVQVFKVRKGYDSPLEHGVPHLYESNQHWLGLVIDRALKIRCHGLEAWR